MRRILHHAGFSLIEIIIALGIFAGAVSVMMSSSAKQMQISAEDEDLAKAIFLARNKMTEIETQIQADMEKNKFPDEEKKSGKFEQPDEDYAWESQIKKIEIPLVDTGSEDQSAAVSGYLKTVIKDISKSVRELKLTVFWGGLEKEDQKSLVLTTHIVNFK